MRRTILILIFSSLAFVPAPWPKSGHANEDLTRMQGRWWRISCATRPVGDPVTTIAEKGEIEMVIAGNLITFTYLKEDRGMYWFTLDVRAKPNAIDLLQGDRHELGIYSLEGNTLIICTQMGHAPNRPMDLAAAHDGQRREVFRRAKP